ncbi:hypothetical protein [Actinoplanes sp. NPDC048796]|uniref:hypothetical protein n=1 Tax=unclassified Actinoplanes TaxID=2626549 RepID=UPI0034083E00
MNRTARTSAALALAVGAIALAADPAAAAAKVKPTIDAAEVTKAGAPIRITGKAAKGATVTIKFNGKAVKNVKAGKKNGKYTTTVKALRSGAFTATASGRTSSADAIKVYVNKRYSQTLFSGSGGVGTKRSAVVTFRSGATVTVKVRTSTTVCTDSLPWIDPCLKWGAATVGVLADLASALTGDEAYAASDASPVYDRTHQGRVEVYSVDAEAWTATAVQTWTARAYI